jgi:putative MATE family efflux protein
MSGDTFDSRSFYAAMLRLAVPIAAQQFVMNALNAVDVLMIGQLGETAVAAVGLSNQVFFVFSLFLFGVGSGSTIFAAQFWGRGDLLNLRRMLGLGLALGVGGGVLFSLAAVLTPTTVLRFYTQDPEVLAQGGRYLGTVGLCYAPTAVTVIFGMVLRSTRQVKIPMAVSMTALSLKTFLAYCLIFGRFGLPQMGIMGGAYATVIARLAECSGIVALTYALRLPTAASLRQMLDISAGLLGRFVRTAWPVVLGEVIWALGIATYTAIYARIGTNSVAAVNISGTIEGVALVPFLGLGNACAILLGNLIGAGDTERAANYALRFLRLAAFGGIAMGLVIALSAGSLLQFYRITAETQEYARGVLLVVAAALWLKAANISMIVGIMRSGGDTRFALFADTAPMWFIGVPMALLGGFVLRLPVPLVVLMVVSDEATKFGIALWRVLSGRWVHNVVRAL